MNYKTICKFPYPKTLQNVAGKSISINQNYSAKKVADTPQESTHRARPLTKDDNIHEWVWINIRPIQVLLAPRAEVLG